MDTMYMGKQCTWRFLRMRQCFPFMLIVQNGQTLMECETEPRCDARIQSQSDPCDCWG